MARIRPGLQWSEGAAGPVLAALARDLSGDWRDFALRAGIDPDCWVPDDGTSPWDAMMTCRRCPVRPECLDDAMASGREEGVWGGVRFIRDDLPGSLVTIAFYAAATDGDPAGFTVERRTEWMVCRDPADPAGTEIWSDAGYANVSPWVSGTAAIADEEARGHAGQCVRYGAGDICWSGCPFTNGDGR